MMTPVNRLTYARFITEITEMFGESLEDKFSTVDDAIVHQTIYSDVVLSIRILSETGSDIFLVDMTQSVKTKYVEPEKAEPKEAVHDDIPKGLTCSFYLTGQGRYCGKYFAGHFGVDPYCKLHLDMVTRRFEHQRQAAEITKARIRETTGIDGEAIEDVSNTV